MKIPHPMTRLHRFLFRGAAILTGLLLILIIGSFFIDEPLRRMVVDRTNRTLDGYSVQLAELDFHPVGFSLTLRGLTIIQDAHPEPPIAILPEIDASVHWRELLSGNLVADWRFEGPQIHINLQQLREEEKDEVPVEKRGWQEVIKQVYPLKINLFEIANGTVTYIDEDPQRPLRISHINLKARNILNIHSPEQTYPSSIHLSADIFDQGHVEIEGRADFLADPHPGVKARFSIENVPLEYFKPIASRVNLIIAGGVLAGSGSVEFAPSIKSTHIENIAVEALRIDYVHSGATAEREKKRVEKAGEVAGEVSNKPGVFFLVDRLHLSGEAGVVNNAADPHYRVFLSEFDLELVNLSNQFREGEAHAELTGKFMGTGNTSVNAAFRPEKDGADFSLDLKIEKTELTAMNDLLRAHGKVDVVAGNLSVYSEVAVKGNRIDGYVKPLFEDLDIYSREQDKKKGLLRQAYEGVVGGLSGLLENEPREQVATRADISGTLENPEASTLEIIVLLLQNGFVKAILPGFERQLATLRR